MHQALMLLNWGPVTLFLTGAFTPTETHKEALNRRGVFIETTPVDRIEDKATVVLVDQRRVTMAGIFVTPRTSINGSLAEQLDCAVEVGPIGDFVATDAMKATNVQGVFCCGDMARAAGNAALAVADGSLAGIFAHRSLIEELALLH
jgi:thioredoxin reductase